MPSQLEHIERSGFVRRRPNFFSIELEHYTVDILLRETNEAVVLFDHAGIAENKPDRCRAGWGFTFISMRTQKTGIFVKPTSSNWFRPPGLYELCIDLAASGFFNNYSSITTYGGSMGGYAAIAYADAFHADFVLSMNPQATLSADLVPWENRFPRGRQQDWTSSPKIASQGCQNTKQTVIVFDRRCAKDAAHVELLDIPSCIELNIPFVGHGIPYHLHKMGLLEALFFDASNEGFDIRKWHKLVRARRELEDYQKRIDKWKANRSV